MDRPRTTANTGQVGGIVGVGMTDTVFTVPFEHALVVAPVKPPNAHVMVGRRVDDTWTAGTNRCVVNVMQGETLNRDRAHAATITVGVLP